MCIKVLNKGLILTCMERKICACLQQIIVKDIHPVASHEIHSKDLSSLKLPNMQIMPRFGKGKKFGDFQFQKHWQTYKQLAHIPMNIQWNSHSRKKRKKAFIDQHHQITKGSQSKLTDVSISLLLGINFETCNKQQELYYISYNLSKGYPFSIVHVSWTQSTKNKLCPSCYPALKKPKTAQHCKKGSRS